MTVNMGPQHPSTHGVLRLVLELSGETVVNADTTIGYLHTGIEKTAEQKKWQQVIPLVERMDYLGAQSNSLAFCLAVEKLLGVEMPERVTNIRVLIAELQRITSHLVWLGTHGLEIGAVSVMMYCFREREQLLNINEMLAGFRMFPSYLRIGGLREDLPTGLPRGGQDVPRRVPRQAATSTKTCSRKNQIWLKRTQGRRRARPSRTRWTTGWSGRWRARPASPYDVRRTFPYLGYETYDFDVPIGTAGDVYDRYLVRMEEMRQSTRIAQQALERITPRGVYDIQDYRIVPPPKDKVYTEMEALIQHFLIYSQGFTVPAGRGLRADRRAARRARLLHRVRRHQPPVPDQAARAVVLRLPGAAEADRRRHDCRRHRRHRLDRRRHGRRGSMSFHPLMVVRRALPQVGAHASSTKGRRSRSRRSAARRSTTSCTKYPPDQEAFGGARRAVSGAGAGRATSRRTAMRHVARNPAT